MGERFHTPALNGFFAHRHGVKKNKNYGLNPPWDNCYIRFYFLKGILCTPAIEKQKQQLLQLSLAMDQVFS
ncbi:MAG TPA: hypothetical protein VFC36_03160 [Paludibacter sp.]|nr:hypothetical protein [Paludibacter sp.]